MRSISGNAFRTNWQVSRCDACRYIVIGGRQMRNIGGRQMRISKKEEKDVI